MDRARGEQIEEGWIEREVNRVEQKDFLYVGMLSAKRCLHNRKVKATRATGTSEEGRFCRTCIMQLRCLTIAPTGTRWHRTDVG